MSNIFIRAVIILAIILLIADGTKAQERKYSLGLSYTTEIQSGFDKKVNWVNLLQLEGQYRPWQSGGFSIQTISVWKTRKRRIIDDLQTFSNIEEDNMAINIFLAGYTHHFNNFCLFGGIRNANEDYFVGNYTSLFTNSSCGIYPTVSINFPVANYPLSAMCLHGEFKLSKTLTLKNSLYNGKARELFPEEGTLFAVRPAKEGVMNVNELSYLSKSRKHEFYNIGSVLYIRHSVHDNDEQKETETQKEKKINYALWGAVEQSVYTNGNKSAGILLQGSFAPAGRNECKHYYGAGVILHAVVPAQKGNTLGVFYNKAASQHAVEQTIELTWKYNASRHLTLQPVLHCIRTGSKRKVIGLIRVCYEI